MTLHDFVCARLVGLGLHCEVVGDEVHIPRQPRTVKIRFDDEWRQAFTKYRQARSINFDEDNRILTHNNSVEFYLQRLAANSLTVGDPYNLEDADGNTVEISPCSHTFKFALFESNEYERYFSTITKERLLERNIFLRRMDQLIWNPTTATYRHHGRKTPANLGSMATAAVKASLFKMSVEQNEPYVLWTSRNRRKRLPKPAVNNSIPRAIYNDDAVSYYKVAKASPFPSQSFLAYYHVMEYYFLRVSESQLQDKLTVALNGTSFNTNKDGLERIISIVRGQDAKSDETEMLRGVLDRFIQESDLIDFIERIESQIEEKLYTKEKILFGEKLNISNKKGHAISNCSKVLKHIRNAIVHSSDRYKREDCHIPLSETEHLIADYIPLIKFCAERVIYGTAT